MPRHRMRPAHGARRSMLFTRIVICLTIIMASAALSCKDASTDTGTNTNTNSSSNSAIGAGDYPCGTYKGHTLYTGPKGGCYYINSNNNKTYVDRSNCNC